jgi:hypothetical protein
MVSYCIKILRDQMKSSEQSRTYCDELLTVRDLDGFKNQLLDEIRALLKHSGSGAQKKWLKSSEVKKLLGISTGTLQNLRVNGSLSYSKGGGIIFYDYNEIVKLIERNEQG